MHIKVERVVLMRGIGEKIRKLNEDHAKALEEYPKQVEKYQKSVKEQLESVLRRVERGDFSSLQGYSMNEVRFTLPCRKPERPSMSSQLCRYKGYINRLKLETRKVLSLRENDDMLQFLDGDACKR
jgi:hypothetical protein